MIGVAPSALGANLLAQVTAAKGSIGDAGGTPRHLAISATALADEDARTGTTGELIYDPGFAAAMGLTAVVVPAPSDPVGLRRARCYLAVRNDAMRRDVYGLALRPGRHLHPGQGPGDRSDPRPEQVDPQAVRHHRRRPARARSNQSFPAVAGCEGRWRPGKAGEWQWQRELLVPLASARGRDMTPPRQPTTAVTRLARSGGIGDRVVSTPGHTAPQ